MESVRIPRRSFEAVEFIENLVDRGGRDTEAFALRSPETVACVGEHGEFPLEICCGSVAHGLILHTSTASIPRPSLPGTPAGMPPRGATP
jgi:hypothetical protein